MRKTVPQNAVLIPESARQVFQGQIFSVYQWPQQLFDGSTETFELLRRPDTVVVLAIKDGKLVVVEDEQPGRDMRRVFPGGRVDEGEEWLAAAQREMIEETGLSFKNWRLVHVAQPTTKIEWFVATFVAFDLIDEIAPVPGPGERITVDLVEFSEIRHSTDNSLTAHLHSLLDRCKNLDDIKALPEFSGKVIER